jgi:hypothetical protein
MPCYYSRLPAELRQLIIEASLPDAEFSQENLESNVFDDALSLLFVNKQMSADTSVLLFRSKQRVCVTNISPYFISTLREHYSHGSWRQYRKPTGHVTKLSSSNLSRFPHHRIDIDLSNSPFYNESFFLLLENFQRVLYAICP